MTIGHEADREGRLDKSTAARIAAHESWARTADRAARTAPASMGLLAKFEREARERLGPDATERQVAEAAESARKAYYLRLSAAGHAAKQAKRQGQGGKPVSE